MIEKIKKVWKDPVWSAVIVFIITSIFSIRLCIILLILCVIFHFFFKKRNSRCGRISYIQDKALFKQIITKDLPESFIYDYLKNHDFGEPVSVDDLNALMDFEWIVDNPQYKFNNPRLEQIKSDLLSSIKSFKDYLLRNTTENEFGRLIISDFIRRDEEKFISYKKELHKWADDICKNYDELIRIMRASA